MGIKKVLIAGVSLLITLAMVLPVATQAALSGLDIMKKVDELPQGDDQKSTVTLHLIPVQGQERKIVTSRYWKNYRGKEGFYSKTLFFTNHPPDAKGTGFLIWDYAEEGKIDGLWLYLPSLRKVSVISTRSQDDAFMGSALTFAAVVQMGLDEDRLGFIGEKPCNGKACYVVQSMPKE